MLVAYRLLLQLCRSESLPATIKYTTSARTNHLQQVPKGYPKSHCHSFCRRVGGSVRPLLLIEMLMPSEDSEVSQKVEDFKYLEMGPSGLVILGPQASFARVFRVAALLTSGIPRSNLLQNLAVIIITSFRTYRDLPSKNTDVLFL